MFKIFIRRPVLSIVIALVIAFIGILSLFNLPITQFPSISPPKVNVIANYPGANNELLIKSVIIPLEQALNGVPGMKYIESDAGNDGEAEINVVFKLGTDPNVDAVNVQNRVSAATNKLPPEVIREGVKISREEPNILMYINLYSDDPNVNQDFLFNYFDINISPELLRVDGVGDLDILGTRSYAMRVWLHPDKMISYGLSTDDVSDALEDQNIEVSPGKLGESGGTRPQVKEYVLKELNQNQAPIYEGLIKLRKKRIVPFDVPGHKRGRGNPELVELLGEKCVGIDVNSMKPLDNLGHPISIIRDAEELAADAFGAAHAFLMIGGTTSSVQTMILSTCKAGDKIILPRNVHKSAINALVLCGAIPIYIEMSVDPKIGIALGLENDRVAQAIKEHPDAKAILINNPTYYGICSDLKSLTEMAHEAGMLVLVDEAHGAHLHFTDKLPLSAMDAGADMAAVSMHKSGGSLTQSSILLIGKHMNPEYVRQIINLTQSTSASYLLMASLDISRRNLALRGKESFEKVIELSEYARREINAIGGYYAYSKELIDGVSVCDFDVTKLSVYTQGIGLTGIEVYDLLRDEYDIQIEFGDIGNILAYISIGDRVQDIERLVGALADIKRLYSRDGKDLIAGEYIQPELVLSPQEAFYSERRSLTLDESVGQVCGEFVMCYPPGIPILAPGERITREIVDYILFAKERGCSLQGTEDPEVNHINVIDRKEN